MKQDDKPLILVVDDTPENLHLLHAVLASESYRVELAPDGPTALRLARDKQPDLILLDVIMPGMDGYAVCRELKAQESTREIPVIFVTGLLERDDETRGFSIGAVDYIHKPFSVPVVLARVKAHLALYSQRRDLEGMFREVIEFAPDAFILTDAAGRIRRVNAQAEQLFGYVRDELLGRPVDILIPQQLRAIYEGFNGQGDAARGPRTSVGVRCLRKNGTEFPAEISLSPLQTLHGLLVMAVVRDVSERKRQEDQLREAARYARSLIEASLDPLVLIDSQGRITDVNAAAERITGLLRDQLIGTEAASKFAQPERLLQGFQIILAKGQVIDYPMAIRHVSGRVTEVLCNASAFRNEQGEVVGVFASARDVTESRRIQEELQASRERLRELAAQNEAVREAERKHIAREVHDELGQVLTALRMDLFLLGLQLGSQSEAMLEKVQGMKGLVDRAIHGVRNVAGNLRPTALDVGLVAAIEWLCAEFVKHTGTVCEFHSDQGAVDLDDTRSVVVFRMVQESLTNITRYAEASRVDVRMRLSGNLLRLEIRDNGRGFDPEAAAKKKSYGLLGMRERALALGGQIEILSAPGKGTSIVVEVPLDLEQEKIEG